MPSPVTQGLEDTLTLWMSMRSILSRPPEEKGHRVREMFVSSASGFTLQCTQRQQQAIVWQRQTVQVMV